MALGELLITEKLGLQMLCGILQYSIVGSKLFIF